MHKYRIGTLLEPWTNKTPPIRGGIFRDPDETSSVDSDTKLSDASTLCACIASNEHEHATTTNDPLRATLKKQSQTTVSLNDTPQKRGGDAAAVSLPRDEATEEYIRKTIQAEVDDNIRDYPSFNPQTQRDIESKYRALHQRVKDGGFYQCHYGEYAKELARYLSIFALFMTALVYGWYKTSAALLGLFWVRQDSRSKSPS